LSDKYKTTEITVEVEGETLHGVPHGQCFVYFIYNGELDDDDYSKPSDPFDASSPYLDG
jgi:hypothetical protein